MIPRYPKEVGLPFQKWHEGQVKSLTWIEEQQEDHHILFLDAPTANGKSGIAYTIPYMLDTSAYWATWSKKLQDQGAGLGIPSIKGRGNFACEAGEKEGLDSCEFKYCDDDDPEADDPGLLAPSCPFLRQFKRGADSDMTILNYAVLFQYMFHPKRALPWRPWLVADEGDVLEDALGGYLDVQLDRAWFEEIDFPIELPSDGRDEERLLNWAAKAVDENLLREAGSRKQRLYWRRAQEMAGKAQEALTHSYIVDDNGLVISLRILWPLKRALSTVLNRFKHVLVMSATLGDIEAMAQDMLLPKGSYTKLSVPSAIPVDRRLIYYAPVSNLKKDATELDYQRMADAIIGWGRDDFPRDRGIVHVSSYAHARKLGRLLFSRGLGYRVFIQDHPGGQVQAKWEASPDGVLVSPVAGLGLDLPYVFPWQVVAKLPYPSLADKIIRLRLAQSKDWYDRKTAHKTVQMAGRVTRLPDDEGLTIIADSSFKMLYHRAPASFPQWFKDALKWESQW